MDDVAALLPWCVLCLALWCAPVWAQASGAKKLIYYGWGIRDTQYIREHWHEMEQMPFDGMGIIVAIDRQGWQQGRQATDNQLGWQVMGKRLFRIEEFREAIEGLKAAKWRAFTDNFLPVALSSGYAAQLSWFDDDRWRVIVNNFGVVAQVAAEGGVKGLLIDPEDYSYMLFKYLDQQQLLDRPLEAYMAMARERGREVMAAIVTHMPEPILLTLYGYTLPLREHRGEIKPQDARYNLLPAFYDGMLEAMPAKGRLVDGYESAYAFKRRQKFLDGYRQVREGAMAVSAVPELYRQKVRAGFGLWLDYSQRPDYFTPEEFQHALGYALEISDEYVWLYAHGPRFFPPVNIPSSYLDAIARARRGVQR
jgi:hypothetical protein